VTPPIEAIDLFCGAGGLAYGLHSAGLRVVAGVDLDPACRFPFEENCASRFHLRDAALMTPTEVASLYSPGAIRLMAGCAPCQPFSTYGQTRRFADGRWQLVEAFLELALAVRPEFVTMENVPRLALRPIWGRLVDGLRESGYNVTWGELACRSYGVPQTRSRLVLLASTLGPISLPRPDPLALASTVRDAIGHLPAIEPGFASNADLLHVASTLSADNLKRIRASRPGGTWRDWPLHLRAPCHTRKKGETYPSVYGRMAWDQPAPTITTQFYAFGSGRFGHPEQDRAISIREAALLQTFPPEYRFVPPGERASFRRLGHLIGNAVPPRLGAAIGRTFTEHWRYFTEPAPDTLVGPRKFERLLVSPPSTQESPKQARLDL
jgi:DNA (cytosine-5)-methyltransferase 1